jgi:pimeloyl-ACP methyl ester carboxylesterase
MLVLLPGLEGTGDLFGHFIRSLPKPCTVQIIRYPRDVPLTYLELERHVLDQLPKGAPITLLAESFSGPIALKISERRDLDLKAVVLVSSFALRPLGWAGPLLARLPISSLLRRPLPAAVTRTFLYGTNASQALVSEFTAALSSVDPVVIADRLKQALTATYGGGHLKPNTRVIALFSKRDRLLGRTALRSIVRAHGEIEAVAIDAPHCALQCSPEEVVRCLVRMDVLETHGCPGN